MCVQNKKRNSENNYEICILQGIDGRFLRLLIHKKSDKNLSQPKFLKQCVDNTLIIVIVLQ